MKRTRMSPTKIFGDKGAGLFSKGVDLFNRGDHWEAHEVFEDVWRGAGGDAKVLAQAFVQLAAAFSYIRRKRYESILYLFDKSVGKFRSTAKLLPEANIEELIAGVARARGEVERLGEKGLDRFEGRFYPRIRLVPPKGEGKARSVRVPP